MEELLDSQVQQQNSNDTDLIKIADGILFDARANLRDKSVIRMPISQLSTLGAGVASLVPAFRTVTRLSLYIFSMASFIEVMLSGDFKEENIRFAKDEIEKMAATYRDIFTQCSVYLEKLSDASLETNLLKGIGCASKAVGKVIENIPIVKEGSVDEFLQDSGKQMKQNAVQIERKVVEAFAAIGNPGVHVFSEKLNDMMQIYEHTSEIYFDKQDIYLVTQ